MSEPGKKADRGQPLAALAHVAPQRYLSTCFESKTADREEFFNAGLTKMTV
jgi:hypothetical protein